jgi:hypothetical protein
MSSGHFAWLGYRISILASLPSAFAQSCDIFYAIKKLGQAAGILFKFWQKTICGERPTTARVLRMPISGESKTV